MPKRISENTVVIRASIGVMLASVTISLLSAIFVALASVTETRANTITVNKWVDPDSVIGPITNIIRETSSPSSAETSQETNWLTWLLLDKLTRPLTLEDHNKVFLSVDTLLHDGQYITASNLIKHYKKSSLGDPHTALLDLLNNQAVALWLHIGCLLGEQQIHKALKTSQNLADKQSDPITASIYKMIWQTLRSMPVAEINDLEANVTEIYSAAWLALTKILAMEASSSEEIGNGLTTWQQKYPNHAANHYASIYLISKKDSAQKIGQSVSLLLPLSSQFSEAANAIRDGFLLASQATTSEENQSIKIYDFGNKTKLIGAYYDTAIRDQTDFIVGPLGASAVQQLTKLSEFPVPTLIFGTLGITKEPISNAYQFSLAAEHDAASLAQRGLRDGHRRVITLYPDTSQGHRIFDAWNQTWTKSGGSVIQSHAFNPQVSDHSQILRELFHLEHSVARRTALQDILGNNVNLKFVARRRQDIDAVFILADINQTRLIKPQIDFHHAHDIVVYSLNSNYTGIPQPVKDLDLEGIVFGEMPWIVNQGPSISTLRARISPQDSRRGLMLDRLFALGLDAYGLIEHLSLTKQIADLPYWGATGTLSISEAGKIIRQPEWFQMRQSEPVHLRLTTLPLPPRLDLKSTSNE